MSMHFRTWFVGLAIVAGLAGAVAMALVWMLVTEPLSAARLLGGGF